MNRLLATLVLVLTTTAAQALDWGVNINNVPLYLRGQSTLLADSIKSTLWAYQPLFGSDFRLEGETAFSASSSGSDWQPGSLSFDLTEASVRGRSTGAAGVFEWDAGRRNVTDLTGGWVFDSRWDGGGLNWFTGNAIVSFSAGYSGLQLKKNSHVSGSDLDVADSASSTVVWAPQRVYASLGGGVNELFARQDVKLEFVGDYDLRTGNGAVHGVYATFATTGPLPLGLRQRVFATGAARIQSGTATGAYLAGAELSATLPFLGSRLVASGEWAQGFGGFGFQPLAGKGMADVISLPSAHGAVVTVDYSLKPVARTTLGLKTSGLFRTSDDAIVVEGFDSSSSAPWLGTEFGAYLSWNPTSEWTVGATGGLFLPQSGAFLPNTAATVLAVVTTTLKL